MKEWILSPVPAAWQSVSDLSLLDWSLLPVLSPFILADGSRPASQQTSLRLGYTARYLFAHFSCQDHDIWGNYTRRDDPIYNEEAVEIFIAPGEKDPLDYFEFEVSPKGVLFDALIHNPDGKNNPHMSGNVSWDCPGIVWQVWQDDTQQRWWAALVIPWRSLTAEVELPKAWRANFYRIERPHGSDAEYSCWSPVMTPVADFHRPARFGIIRVLAYDAG